MREAAHPPAAPAAAMASMSELYDAAALARSSGAAGAAAWHAQGSLAATAAELDLARVDAGVAAAAAALEEGGLDAAGSAAGSEAYGGRRADLRAALAAVGAAPLPRLSGLDWRLDYVVRASDGAPKLVPVYYVTLRLAADGAGDGRGAAPRDDAATLTLSVEQMSDFLLMVRDANHQAQRLTSP